MASETVTTTTTTAVPGAPAPGHLVLALENVGGNPPFELLGATMTVRGTVTPYVAGQTVAVTFYLTGQKVGEENVAVLPGANGTGTVQLHLFHSLRWAGGSGRVPRRDGTSRRRSAHARRACALSRRRSARARKASRCDCCNRS